MKNNKKGLVVVLDLGKPPAMAVGSRGRLRYLGHGYGPLPDMPNYDFTVLGTKGSKLYLGLESDEGQEYVQRRLQSAVDEVQKRGERVVLYHLDKG